MPIHTLNFNLKITQKWIWASKLRIFGSVCKRFSNDERHEFWDTLRCGPIIIQMLSDSIVDIYSNESCICLIRFFSHFLLLLFLFVFCIILFSNPITFCIHVRTLNSEIEDFTQIPPDLSILRKCAVCIRTNSKNQNLKADGRQTERPKNIANTCRDQYYIWWNVKKMSNNRNSSMQGEIRIYQI